MPRIKMTRIETAAGTPSTVIDSPIVPVFRGSGGDHDHECAGCEATLIENVEAGQFNGMMIRCPRCGTVGQANSRE
jgi:hypothetical protein